MLGPILFRYSVIQIILDPPRFLEFVFGCRRESNGMWGPCPGMNMGFNDAKNIAWKLAWAAKGTVPLNFLASYENERQPLEHKILVAIDQGAMPSGGRRSRPLEGIT